MLYFSVPHQGTEADLAYKNLPEPRLTPSSWHISLCAWSTLHLLTEWRFSTSLSPRASAEVTGDFPKANPRASPQSSFKTPKVHAALKRSKKKVPPEPGSMHDTGCLGLVHWDNPEGWCGEGGGFRMGSTCIPVADSFWCLAKLIQCLRFKNKIKLKKKTCII